MATCPDCGYPREGADCANPGCFANPAVSAATKARWRQEAEKRASEQAEREALARARAAAFEREE